VHWVSQIAINILSGRRWRRRRRRRKTQVADSYRKVDSIG